MIKENRAATNATITIELDDSGVAVSERELFAEVCTHWESKFKDQSGNPCRLQE